MINKLPTLIAPKQFTARLAEPAHWDEALQYIGITARAIDSYSDRLDAATALLRN